MRRGIILAAAAAMLVAAPVAAQNAGAMPESYRDVQVRMLELQRRLLLSMVDSMPERLYRDPATPIQRDFARQIHHATSAMGGLVPRFMGVAPMTGVPDTSVMLNSRAALRAYVASVYDYAVNVVRTQSAADRAAIVPFFGTQLPRWQVWDELHQHTIWTAGQIVANFRKHGMAPPGFGFF